MAASYLIRSLRASPPTRRKRTSGVHSESGVSVKRAVHAAQRRHTDPAGAVDCAIRLLSGRSRRGDLTSRSVFFALVGLLVVDLFWNSNQFDRTSDRSRVFPRTEITDRLRSLPPGRVLVTPSGLETNRSSSAGAGAVKIIAPPNTLLAYQIPTVSGKNQQFPKWYREFASLIEPQPNLSHVVFDQHRSPVLRCAQRKIRIDSRVRGRRWTDTSCLQPRKAYRCTKTRPRCPERFSPNRTVEAQSHDDALAPSFRFSV